MGTAYERDSLSKVMPTVGHQNDQREATLIILMTYDGFSMEESE